MTIHTLNTRIDGELRQLKDFIQELFPTPDSLTFSVPSAVQQAESAVLRAGRRTEQFYFVVDFVKLTITEAAGMEEMGYTTRTFTFRDYLSMLAPGGMMQLVMLLGKQTFVLSDQALLTFLKPKFVAHLPMTHADGRVLLVKRTISPWQFTESGRMTAYLSEFTILKLYKNEPINPRFIDIDPKVEGMFNSMVTRLFAHQPPEQNPLSTGEITLLKFYSEPGNRALTANETAEKFGVKPNTIKKHNANIVSKTKDLFYPGYLAKTAQEVAQFMKSSGLLG